MKSARTLGFAVTLVLPALSGLACGGSPPPAPSAPVVSTSPKEASIVDTSAVPEPKTLLLFARLSHPSASLRTAAGWAGMPMSFDGEIASALVGKHAGAAIDLDQPVDFVAASDPAGRAMKPYYAYSIAVRSPDEAQRQLAKDYDASPGAGGVIRLDPKKGGSEDDPGGDDDDEAPRRCELAPSAGSSPMRFICAGNDAALELLAPYLARTAPRTSFAADLHVDVRLDPLKPMIKNSRAMVPIMVRGLLGQQKMNEPAMAEVINGILGDTIDFTLDLDRLKFDAKLADAGAKGTLVTTFHDQTSLISKLVTSHPERAAVPPEAFWNLPSDADVAFFSRGGEPKELEHARDLLLQALHHNIDLAGGKPADAQAFDAAVAHAIELTAAPSVFAKGLDVVAAERAVAAAKAKPGSDRAAMAQIGGYGLIGMEAPAAEVQAVLKEWSALVSRPGIAKWIKQSADNGAPATTFKVVPVAAKLGLPKGTVGFDLTTVHSLSSASSEAPTPAPVTRRGGDAKKGNDKKTAGKGAPAKAAKPKLDKPVTLHLFAVPDGGRTWIVYGLDATLAADHVKAALHGAPEDKTLAKHRGLEALRAAKVNAGGFLDVRGVTHPGALGFVFGGAPSSIGDAFRDASAGGETPVLFTLTAEADPGSNARSAVDTIEVPRAAITEMVQMAMRHH